jgi:hypothetical protein
MASGEATAEGIGALPRARALRPERPGEGEAILWQGRPAMMARKLAELAGFLLLLGLLTWLAIELLAPHLSGSGFAGTPDGGALALILAMVAGMVLIIALPVWLRSSARARASYMLTTRRALVWLGDSIVAEAVLFGAEMRVGSADVSFVAPGLWLDWRLKDEGMDRLRFEQIADALTVAQLAEAHGARWIDPPPEAPADDPPADEALPG